MATQAQITRQWQRKTLKEIEAVLHPCPIINGLAILHEHKGKYIIFSAWGGDSPANTKQVKIPRMNVLTLNFNKVYAEDLRWLTESTQ